MCREDCAQWFALSVCRHYFSSFAFIASVILRCTRHCLLLAKLEWTLTACSVPLNCLSKSSMLLEADEQAPMECLNILLWDYTLLGGACEVEKGSAQY